METVLFLLVVGGITAGAIKYRAEASRERRAVLARINDEQLARGDVSPTAELFREVGVPVGALSGHVGNGLDSEPSRQAGAVPPPTPAPSPPPSPAAAPPRHAATPNGTGDLATMFAGIQMPAGLTPFGPMSAAEVAFVTNVAAREVQPALTAELSRIGAEVVWVEPTVAQVRRGDHRAGLTIFPRPELAVDLDGNRIFPTAPSESCVVRLTLS